MKKTLVGLVLGIAICASQPSLAMDLPSGAAASGLAVTAVLASGAATGMQSVHSQMSQNSQMSQKKGVKQLVAKKAKKDKPRKGAPRGAPEIDAASGSQALALLIGVLLLGAERIRRYS